VNFYKQRKSTRAVSIGFAQLFQITPEIVTQNLCRNMIDIILDKDLPIRTSIPTEDFAAFIALEARRYTEEYGKEVIRDLIAPANLAEFDAYLAFAATIPAEVVFSPAHKKVRFKREEQTIELTFAREALKQNPRFDLIEFFS
jgi:hypothetical protein